MQNQNKKWEVMYIGHHGDVEGGLCKLKGCIPVVDAVVMETGLVEGDFGGGVFGDKFVHDKNDVSLEREK